MSLHAGNPLDDWKADAKHWEQMYLAELAHSENLAKSALKAIAELAAAILVIKEIDGRAQTALDDNGNWASGPPNALRDIRTLCEKALTK